MIKLYGITQSCAFRPRWLLEELGLDYEQIRTFTATRSNPPSTARSIPTAGYRHWSTASWCCGNRWRSTCTWRDATVATPACGWTTSAARHWPGSGRSGHDRGRTPAADGADARPRAAGGKRDPQRVSRNRGVLERPFRVLDEALQDRDYCSVSASWSPISTSPRCCPGAAGAGPFERLSQARRLARPLPARPACARAT